MAETIRFPLLASGNAGPLESDQVITLMTNAVSLPRGGVGHYTAITPWKLDAKDAESPFTCVVVEFEQAAGQSFTIGDGVVPIGLYGEIITGSGTSFKTLLGILGLNTGGTNVPQIFLDINGPIVGFSQKVSDIACYDNISVGGVGAAIALAETNTVTVRLRPIRRRSWMG